MPHSNTGDFAPLFHLLLREANLARSSVIFGLNALRKAGIDDRQGQSYVAAFQLSTAIERLLKLVLILDYMVSHGGSTPPREVIKKFSHDLVGLLAACRKVAEARGSQALVPLIPTSVEMRLLQHLSDFAREGRYFNLDTIGGHQATHDFLPRLHALSAEVFNSEVPPKVRKRIAGGAAFMSAVLGGMSYVVAHDPSGAAMDLEQTAKTVGMYKVAAPYVTRHAALLVRRIVDLLEEIGDQARGSTPEGRAGRMDVPAFGEVFAFLPLWPAYLLRRRRWQ